MGSLCTLITPLCFPFTPSALATAFYCPGKNLNFCAALQLRALLGS